MKKKILVYADLLLPYSATFIPAQVDHLKSYEARYLGSMITQSFPSSITKDQIVAYHYIRNSSKAYRAWHKITGHFSPEIKTAVRQLMPSLIHAHFAPDALWVLPLKHHLKLPLISTIHSPNLTMYS